MRDTALAATVAGVSVLVVAGVAWGGGTAAYAAEPRIELGTAGSFAVLAGSTVTNTGASNLQGSLGLAPGSSVTGFPPGQITDGVTQISNGVALQAQADLTAAYTDAELRPTSQDVTGVDLGGQVLKTGVFQANTSMSLTGTVTLDAEGDPNAVFIFKAGSTLITGSNATVSLVNGAQPCRVFWQVGTSATLGTDTDFVGTIMTLTSATLGNGVDLEGRVLARNGAVTLDSNDITAPRCATTPPSSSATATPTATSGSPTTTTPSDSTANTSTPTPTDDTTPPADGPTDGDATDADDGGGDGDGDSGDDGDDGDGDGDGDGDAGGGGESSGGPIVPVGHPATGTSGTQHPLTTWPALLGIGVVVAVGAASARLRRRPAPRHR